MWALGHRNDALKWDERYSRDGKCVFTPVLLNLYGIIVYGGHIIWFLFPGYQFFKSFRGGTLRSRAEKGKPIREDVADHSKGGGVSAFPLPVSCLRQAHIYVSLF